MSSTILQAKPENVDTPEKRKLYTVAIVGCGLNGIVHAHMFAAAGFKVICSDTDQSIVSFLARSKSPPVPRWIEQEWRKHIRTAQLKCTSDVKEAVSQADVILITINVKIDRRRTADHSNLENAGKQVGANIRKGTLVLVTGVSGIGVAEDVVLDGLQSSSGFKAGVDFGFACSPYTPSFENSPKPEEKIRRIVAASDRTSLNVASTTLQTIMPNVQILRADRIRVVEAAAIFESVWNSVEAGFCNELSLLCEKTDVDWVETLELMQPIRSEPLNLPRIFEKKAFDRLTLLLDGSENSGVKLKMLLATLETEKDLIKHIVSLSHEALRSCGKTIRRAKVAILGLTQNPDPKGELPDTAKRLIKMFESRGAKTRVYDPYFAEDQAGDTQLNLKTNLNEAIETADCLVVLTKHNQFQNLNLQKVKLMTKMPIALIDVAGVFEPSKVEKEGMVYRGLGRGSPKNE